MNRISAFLATAAIALSTYALGAEPVISVPGEVVTNGFDPVERANEQRALFETLWSRQLPVDEPAVSVQVTEGEKAQVSGGQPEDFILSPLERRQRVGVVKSASHGVDFRNARASNLLFNVRSFARGTAYADANGLTWTATVEAPDATALRLHFTAFRLPANAALYIYNEDGQAFGPYTGDGPTGNGQFWSHTIPGSLAYVQLQFDGTVTDESLRGMHFTIAGVGHLGPLYQLYPVWSVCQDNESCVKLWNDQGVTLNSAVSNARKAVAHMQFVSGAWIYFCSGGLLVDTTPLNQINYFLTANHCISKSSEANSLETYFLFEQCNGQVPPGTLGATLLSTNRTGDYTLLRLNDQVPNGTARLGWTNTPVASSNNTPLYRISHPSGAPQAYSEHRVDTGAPTCRSWPRGNWIYSRDTFGATAGGSSGSPVVNAAGQVVGQLSGACGYNVNDVCDTNNNATVDGAFAAYYSNISQWLGGGVPANQAPKASFTSSSSGLTVTFTDTSTDDGSLIGWSWDFGDGNTGINQSPIHTYSLEGIYPVSLTVTDNNGATGDTTANVTVSESPPPPVNTITIASLVGRGESGGSRSRWTVTIDITVGPPVNGATVSGSWSGRANGSASCTTDDSGTCSVSKSNLKSGGTATLTITGIQHQNYTYQIGAVTSVEVNAPQ